MLCLGGVQVPLLHRLLLLVARRGVGSQGSWGGTSPSASPSSQWSLVAVAGVVVVVVATGNGSGSGAQISDPRHVVHASRVGTTDAAAAAGGS